MDTDPSRIDAVKQRLRDSQRTLFVVVLVILLATGGVVALSGFTDRGYGFENEPADAGTPDELIAPGDGTGNTVGVTDSVASTGSQSMYVNDDPVTDSGLFVFDHNPDTTSLENFGVDFYFTASSTGAEGDFLYMYDANDNPVGAVRIHSGPNESPSIDYHDGTSWTEISGDVYASGWTRINITNIDPQANEYTVSWDSDGATGSGSGSATVSSRNNIPSEGYETIRLSIRADNNDDYVDNLWAESYQDGGGGGTPTATQPPTATAAEESLNIDSRLYLEHGQTAPFSVLFESPNADGRLMRDDVTNDSTITVGDTDVVTVDQTAGEITATDNVSINRRTYVEAEYTSGGETFTTRQNVTVANATVDNLKILPTWTKTSASIGDNTIQAIIVATIIAAATAIAAGSFAGIAAHTIVMAAGWLMGYVGNGMVIVSFLFAIFVGLNVATNFQPIMQPRG